MPLMNDARKFKEYMTVLCELFDKPVSGMLTSVYWKALQPFTDDECKRAFEAVMAQSRFFPKPVDFIEILRGKAEDRAAAAWIKVVEAVRRIGPWQSVAFDDPVIHSVFKFWGGWPVVANWQEAELKWKQKEFERLYGIMATGGGGGHPSYLPGLSEIKNAADGFDVKAEVVRIGHHGDGVGQKRIAPSQRE